MPSVAVLSDIHGKRWALKAVLTDIGRRDWAHALRTGLAFAP